MKCIYCLEEKQSNYFQSTEHVLPQSFGKFKNNLTLNKIVCDDCNQYFGKNLEISLGRDTFEGMIRFDHNIKKLNKFKSPGRKSRINIKVIEGTLKGAYAYQEYSESEGKIVIKPIPQLGFKEINNAEYVYFPLEKIPSKEYLENNFELKASKSIIVLGCSTEEAQKIFVQIGIPFNLEGEFYPSNNADWACEVTGQIDQIIFRAIAKIAFNYLAYWQGSDFVIGNQFQPIRKYIRYGEQGPFPFVVILEKAILGDEQNEGIRRLGHLITLDWARNGQSIFSQVSLLNWMTYSVLLAKEYKDKVDIRRGNFFSIGDKTIYELAPGNMINGKPGSI